MLDAGQRRQVGERIEADLVRLAGEIDTLRTLTAPVSPDRAIGRLSRLEAMNEKSMNEAALAAALALQRRLRGARGRLEHEDFGLCSECDEPIPLARLLSIPDARMCVACRELSES
jgi:DnaK suppressor protein